jgi:hypothetical protein
MSLSADAIELSEVLNSILTALGSYDHGRHEAYARAVRRRLAPLVKAYDRAVFITRSRQQAADLAASIKHELENLSAASTKGEMGIIEDEVLDRYWHLHAIFRETRHRDKSV